MTLPLPSTSSRFKISLAPLYVALLIVLFGSLSFFKGAPSYSLEERCDMKNGEWLHGSAVPTCITADGRWLTYDDKQSDFVVEGTTQVASIDPPIGSPVIAHAAETQTTSCKGTFGDYPATQTNIKAAAINFSSLAAASKFHSAITRGAAHGVNYAGHYIVSSFGCPDFKSCEQYAVIDAADGKIIQFGDKVLGHPRYLVDSKLLQVTQKDGSVKTFLVDDSSSKLNVCVAD